MENVIKTYKVQQREKSIIGVVKSFFTKNYKEINAVNNLSLTINKGELVGYIGVNGAGKSTTIKMLVGILAPTKGKISVLGKDPHKHRREIAKRIGVVFGQRSQLIWDLPPIDTLDLFSKIYEIPKDEYRNRLKYLVEHMGIEDIVHVPVRKLSLGQRMCCEIVASLLHNPEILFLDEPTIGLDIFNKEKVRNFIKKLNEELGTTVILTSHDLSDIENLCRRIIIIDKGSIIFDGTLEDLKTKYGTKSTIKIELIEKSKPVNFDCNDIKVEIDYNNNFLYIRYSKRMYRTTDLINLVIQNLDGIKDISIIDNNLEDIVKEIYLNKHRRD